MREREGEAGTERGRKGLGCIPCRDITPEQFQVSEPLPPVAAPRTNIKKSLVGYSFAVSSSFLLHLPFSNSLFSGLEFDSLHYVNLFVIAFGVITIIMSAKFLYLHV